MSDTTYKTGTCRWCSEKGDIYRNNLLCEQCDSDTVHCRVCRRRQHYQSKCRHVFQRHGWGEWCGAGVDPSGYEMMRPFHLLLSAMGEDFARDLKAAIQGGEFHTWMVASMLGGCDCLSLYGMPERDGRRMVHAWGDDLISLGESDRAEIFSDGYHWLVSLYNRSTTKANRTTITWIDQWLWPFTPRSAQ